MLSDQQFDLTRKLALRLAGIELLDRHRELLGRRTRRLGFRDPAGVAALLGAAERGDRQASRQLIGLVTTNFTTFFRHPAHFDLAAEHAFHAARNRGRARLWSAASATGEEPYSLAIALLERFGQPKPPATILATDIDEEAVAAARRGEYGEPALRAVDAERRRRYFEETSVARRWRIAPAPSRLLEFRWLNLTDAAWRIDGPFDVIFCRNVLMSLHAAHREAVLERLVGRLAPDGLIILDPVEHLGRAAHAFSAVAAGVYQRHPRPWPSREPEP